MIDKFFRIAAEIATIKDDSRLFRVGCCAIRCDDAIVMSSNGPVMMGSLNSSTRKSFPAAHAEIRCAKKMDKNSIVFVARVRKDNFQYAMARPCNHCMCVLLAKNVNRIYYTIDANTYGVIYVKNKRINAENVHQFR